MIERIPVETVVSWIEDFKLEKPNEIVTVPHALRSIIMGMVSKESEFNPKAPKFEHGYPWLVSADVFAKKLEISISTEMALQRFSYGLMQVMGANCRAMGYQGNLFDLTQDFQRAFNFGIRFFLIQVERYSGDIEKALAAYNTGSATPLNGQLKGQAYVNDVFTRSKTFQKKYGAIA